ncbi:MAG: SDR family oxidoreductase [Terriglobia bacterium]|jgi:NAD(P)-dependent dehydrogenase (short-subunit alcohol dehydrogenase family)
MACARKRVCLLTGASGKLGSAFCRLYASKYHIAAVYRNHAPQVTAQNQSYVDPLSPAACLPENEHPVFAIRADLGSDAELNRVVELVLARFGRIDLVINAAVYYAFGHIVESSLLLTSLEAQFNVNALVPLKLAAKVARDFWRNRDLENRRMNRNVINVSSVSGLYVTPRLGHSAYAAAKAALNLLTLHMAHEFQDFGVRANACAPTSFPQIVSTESVARSIRRLDEGRMTGTILVIGKAGERFIPGQASSGAAAGAT